MDLGKKISSIQAKETPSKADSLRIMDEEKRMVNLQAFFEEGFEQKEWLNVTGFNLPCILKYMGNDEFEAKFGSTYRYYFQTSTGQEARLLCKAVTFHKAISHETLGPAIGNLIVIFKNEKGYWQFRYPTEDEK